MTKFGDLLSDIWQPSQQVLTATASPGWVWNNNTQGDNYMYNIVTRWTARVTAEAHVTYTWSGNQQVLAWITSGTQGLSFAPAAQTLVNWGYSYETLTVIGAWDSVAAGVDLSIWLHTYVAGGGPNVTVDGFSLDVRLQRL